MRMKSTAIALLGMALAGLAFSEPARAQATKKKPTAVATPAVPADTVARLQSGDEAKIRAALDDVRLAGTGATALAPHVAAVLDAGVTAALAEAALDTLGELGAASVAESAAAYLHHREAKVRRAATRALAQLPGAAGVQGLRRALSDPDPQVRGLAATGLAKGGPVARVAVPDLFRALTHRVTEAAPAIGQLCAPEDCDTFLGRLGRDPFESMAAGFERMLLRPDADLHEDTKIKAVQRVRDLSTPEANKFLRDLQGQWPSSGNPRVKAAIDQAVKATGGDGS